MTSQAIDPRVDIGHVHLKVADIQRSLDFYFGILGFEEQARYGDQAVFISAGGYHTTSGSTPGSRAAARPPPDGTFGTVRASLRSGTHLTSSKL